MNRTEFIGKLQMCYFGDRDAFEEILSVYDKQQKIINKIKHILDNQMDFREFLDMINAIEEVLKED